MAPYVHGHGEAANAHATRTATNSCGYLLPRLEPGMRVLDVGCGPGSITLDLAQLVAPGEVVGLDAGEAVVDAARTAARERDDATTRFVVGDLLAPGRPEALGADAGFDVVHAHQVLQHVSDPVEALRRMANLCRPGGLVAAREADYAGFIFWPQPTGLGLWLEVYRRMARAAGGEPDAGRRLLGWAHEAGLTQVQASASVWSFATGAERDWWASSWRTRIREPRFVDQAHALGVDDAQLRSMDDGWRQWQESADGWFAVPHGEIIALVADDEGPGA